MNERNFIDHSARFDPEASEREIENVSLETQYSKLTEHERNLIFARINGYRAIPPSCLQLIEDEYYLGGEKFFSRGTTVFDYWKKTLSEEIFQGEFFTKKPYLILSGAINKPVAIKFC